MSEKKVPLSKVWRMKKKMDTGFETPFEWLQNNRRELAKYAGEWIAFTNTGVIAHDKNGKILAQKARLITQDFVFKYVHPLEIPRVIRIFPIRVRSLKNNKWVPDYLVELSTSSHSDKFSMLVDSGADISIIPKFVGEDLGLKIDETDYIDKAEGVNGTVDYIIKNLSLNIDGHSFKAPVGWVITEEVDDILLGREVVFDIFDVEFKQSKQLILFKKNENNIG